MDMLQKEKYSIVVQSNSDKDIHIGYLGHISKIKIKPSKIGCKYYWCLGVKGETSGNLVLDFEKMISKYATGVELTAIEKGFVDKMKYTRNKTALDYARGNYLICDITIFVYELRLFLRSECNHCKDIHFDVVVYYYRK